MRELWRLLSRLSLIALLALVACGNVDAAPNGGRVAGHGWSSPAGWDSFYIAGNDGDLVFDGVSTVAGLSPSSGVYTLSRDLAPHDMEVQAGVRVKTSGWAIFGSGTLTVDGQIDDNGNDAVGGTAGASRTTHRYGSGAAGGAGGSSGGGTTGAPQGFFVAVSQVAGKSPGTPGGTGGLCQGGSGGGGSAGSSGGSGTISLATGGVSPVSLIVGKDDINNTRYGYGCGGGPGGIGSGVSTDRGAGGAGGGHCFVAFPFIVGSGVISADGGKGGDGINGSGGGGGGGGGLVTVRTESIASSVTVRAAGGEGGAGDAANGGADGGRGGDCVVSLRSRP